MKVIDLTFDGRICGYCATAVCSYEWYLAATTGAEANLKIQRAIISDSKAYQTLRADLKRGCILPPVVVAISNVTLPAGLTPETLSDGTKLHGFIDSIQTQLNAPKPPNTFIVDGLQRTNALRQTLEEFEDLTDQKHRFLANPLRIEIWLNISFGAIAYRMLLLNAGQRPMSIKRQVEVLSMKLREDLQTIPNIQILMSLADEKRTGPGQFTLAKLSQAFQAWLQGAPNIDLRNTVMEQLLAESAIDTIGTSLSGASAHDDFKSLVQWFIEMDTFVWPTHPQFFANETVLLGISAAVGAAQRNETLRERMLSCLDMLKSQAEHGKSDVLAISRFNELRQGEDVRKVNVGVFTRDMVYRAFQELFVSDGTKSMKDCWAFGVTSQT